MKRTNLSSILKSLEDLGIQNAKGILWNLEPAQLVEEAVKRGEGVLTDTGALMCDTGPLHGAGPQRPLYCAERYHPRQGVVGQYQHSV